LVKDKYALFMTYASKQFINLNIVSATPIIKKKKDRLPDNKTVGAFPANPGSPRFLAQFPARSPKEPLPMTLATALVKNISVSTARRTSETAAADSLAQLTFRDIPKGGAPGWESARFFYTSKGKVHTMSVSGNATTHQAEANSGGIDFQKPRFATLMTSVSAEAQRIANAPSQVWAGMKNSDVAAMLSRLVADLKASFS
jgi:hypothetical protein